MSSSSLDISYTVYGDILTYDAPVSAGKSGQKEGAKFEREVYEFLKGNDIVVPTHYYNNKKHVTRPAYTNYVGARGKRGDMIAFIHGSEYHVECKRLNDCGSHIEKLAYIDMNQRNNCYNLPFLLVYSKGVVKNEKLQELNSMMNSIRQGGATVFEYNDFRRWVCESKNEKDT